MIKRVWNSNDAIGCFIKYHITAGKPPEYYLIMAKHRKNSVVILYPNTHSKYFLEYTNSALRSVVSIVENYGD